jgi:hypothetical protein
MTKFCTSIAQSSKCSTVSSFLNPKSTINYPIMDVVCFTSLRHLRLPVAPPVQLSDADRTSVAGRQDIEDHDEGQNDDEKK